MLSSLCNSSKSVKKKKTEFSVLSLSGCILLLDQDSLYSDTACTTLCTNTQNVRGWKDKSVSANNAINATSAFTCLTNHSSFNGKNVYYHPAGTTANTNAGLTFTKPFTLPYNNSTCTIFFCALTSNLSADWQGGLLKIGTSSNARQICFGNAMAEMDENGTPMINSGINSIAVNVPYVLSFTSGSNQNGYINGTVFSTSNTIKQFTRGDPTIYVLAQKQEYPQALDFYNNNCITSSKK